MTMIFDVDDLAARLPEMLAEVEAGNEVVLARGATPVARVRREPDRPARPDAEAAVAALREHRKNFRPITVEEIIAWKNEGRR